MLAMRHYMRGKMIEGVEKGNVLSEAGLTPEMVEDMYKTMAIANYEDRYVIPTGHREETLDAYGESGACGFSFGNGCSSHSNTEMDLFDSPSQTRGRAAAGKDNRINTIFKRDHHELNVISRGALQDKGNSSGGCGSGGGCGSAPQVKSKPSGGCGSGGCGCG
jgi:hypothetical protein